MAEMLVYYIFRRVGAARQERGRRMNFDGFLGNGALKARLQESFRQGKTSHCYLLCGVEGSGRMTLALRMAAALECRDETNPGCGVCPACRKVLSGQHPDVITVDDTEHKNVAVDIIRQARSDVFIRPNEGRKKVYILPRGQDLGAPSQNALLKILEEPPDYAVFLLLTTSAEKLLPTIRSRAVQLQLSPLTPGEALPELRQRFPDESEQNLSSALEQAEGYLGPACEALKDGLFSEPALGLANGFAARDTLALLQVLVPMEKYKREQVLPVLEQTRKLLSMAMRARAGERAAFGPVQALLRGRTGAELLQAAELLQQAADDLNGNVGVGAVIGGLCVHLR